MFHYNALCWSATLFLLSYKKDQSVLLLIFTNKSKYIKKLNHIYQKQLPEVFYEKYIPKNFTKFTGKHLFQGLFFTKVAGLSLQLY